MPTVHIHVDYFKPHLRRPLCQRWRHIIDTCSCDQLRSPLEWKQNFRYSEVVLKQTILVSLQIGFGAGLHSLPFCFHLEIESTARNENDQRNIKANENRDINSQTIDRNISYDGKCCTTEKAIFHFVKITKQSRGVKVLHCMKELQSWIKIIARPIV